MHAVLSRQLNVVNHKTLVIAPRHICTLTQQCVPLHLTHRIVVPLALNFTNLHRETSVLEIAWRDSMMRVYKDFKHLVTLMLLLRHLCCQFCLLFPTHWLICSLTDCMRTLRFALVCKYHDISCANSHATTTKTNKNTPPIASMKTTCKRISQQTHAANSTTQTTTQQI